MSGELELEGFRVVRRGRATGPQLDLRCPPGRVLALVGPNGSGKSSLLAALARSGPASRGAARVAGEDLRRVSAARRARLLAYLPQHPHAAVDVTAREAVLVGVRAVRRAATDADIALERLGLAHLASRRLGTLSGGQRQLVHLARVLAQDAPVVVLDEPTSALDLAHVALLERVLRELADEGRIVVLAVHDLGVALGVADDALLLDGSGVVAHGPAHQVLTAPRLGHAYGVPTVVGVLPGGRWAVAPGAPPRNPPVPATIPPISEERP